MKRLFSLLLLVFACSTLHTQEPVRFFQFTDAHLFDDGDKMPREEAFKVAADDRRAFRWAIAAMNASDFHPDFAVFTGDLGLQNVDFSQSRCAATPVPLDAEGLPPFRLDNAVEEVADLLAPLKVTRIFFVAGNNDVIHERIADASRFSCFLALLQERMKVKHGAEVYPLLTRNAFVIRGLRFAGMDTVSIKSKDNFASPCGIAPEPINCPHEQISLIGDLADDSPQPLVIFTHAPDLIDPYRKHPVWDIDDALRKDWEQTACGPKVIGIFTGHFHDSALSTYAGVDNALAVNPCVAAKTRVAPPLSGKYQLNTADQARGFLRVTISPAGIQSVDASWYTSQTVVPPAK
ncbi:metallophosphoesterase family protein [Terriglobus tenax]|uniref:metallophosphoesterase family protein n=1 Tax=Terriglobus tenax TaxID=1111115 RepID=UPI0021E02F2C|nr:hypothetical protein [Terriglobus tenax]